jgi:hypothetical protein
MEMMTKTWAITDKLNKNEKLTDAEREYALLAMSHYVGAYLHDMVFKGRVMPTVLENAQPGSR